MSTFTFDHYYCEHGIFIINFTVPKMSLSFTTFANKYTKTLEKFRINKKFIAFTFAFSNVVTNFECF